jgi:hypothetical protein
LNFGARYLARLPFTGPSERRFSMRAEIEATGADIERSIGLLRRRL